MTTTTFDTLKVNRNLKAAGFDEAQADAIVDSMAEVFGDIVATKADLEAMEARIKAETFRALWIQGAGLVGIQLTIAGLLFAAIRFWS